MKVFIPDRKNAPATELFVKIIKRDQAEGWSRDVFILIHGGPGGNHSLYSELVDDLLPLADLVLIDLRGCGLSDPAEVVHCTLEHHIQDLEVVRDSLKIAKPIIHGTSYGAMVALGYAIEFPNHLSQLILVSGAVGGDFIDSARRNLSKIGTPEQIKMADLLWNGLLKSNEEFSKYYSIMAPLYIFNPNKQQQPPTAQSPIPYNVELVNFAFTGFLKNFNFRDRLNEVSVATLLIFGKNDWTFDPSQAQELNEGIKGSKLAILEECGHFPWKDQKETYLQSLKNFILCHSSKQNDTNTENCGTLKSF